MKLIFLFALMLIFSLQASAQSKKIMAKAKHLAFTNRIKAPEGIALSPTGTVFTTSMLTGKVYAMKKGEIHAKVVFDFTKLKEWIRAQILSANFTQFKPMLLGIFAESDHELWVGVPNVNGGCIYHIDLQKKGRKAWPVFCRAGDVNGIVLDKKRGRLYATSRYVGLTTSGPVMSISLNKLKWAASTGNIINYDEAKHLMVESDMPNSLSLSKDETHLLYVKTFANEVWSINLETKHKKRIFSSEEDGWLDGLTYIKNKDLYVATDCKLGKLHFFDFSGSKKGTVEIINQAGVATGLASVVVKADEVYVTDLWEGGYFGKTMEQLFGTANFINYHSRVYKFSLDKLLQ